MKNPWVIIGIITVVLFGGAIWFSSVSSEQNNDGVEVTEHIKGNPEAAVTLTEYSDLQCPACASFQPVLKEIFANYEDGLKLEFKHFPLPIHKFSTQSAVATEAAGQQGKFFEFHDLLFENQQEWSTAAVPSVYFEKYAEELGLDIPTFRRHMQSTVLRDRVQADFAEGRELGINGTPTFFLNGERMQYETFQQFIEQIAFAIDPSLASSSSPGGAGVKFGI